MWPQDLQIVLAMCLVVGILLQYDSWKESLVEWIEARKNGRPPSDKGQKPPKGGGWRV